MKRLPYRGILALRAFVLRREAEMMNESVSLAISSRVHIFEVIYRLKVFDL